MLIEAAKGGHANVACLLIDAQLHQTFLPPDSPMHPGYTSPVSSASKMSSASSYHSCQHVRPTDQIPPHECQFHCQHLQQPSMQQQLPQPDCFPHNIVQPVVQPNASNNFQNIRNPLMTFDEPYKQEMVDANTSPPSDLFLPNIPVSLANSLSFGNLTQADLQSLAQALSFSSSINAGVQQEQQLHVNGTVVEKISQNSNITFPAVDPQVESFTTQSEVCTPSPSDTTTALVTSAGRTIASTGVQTEDAMTMMQKLTNSFHQLNALKSFADAHNLELVNLGEITLPPAPFSIEGEHEEEIMVAESARTLQDSMASVTREGRSWRNVLKLFF